MSLQSEVTKSIGAVGVVTGLYKASPKYKEMLRMKGLSKEETYKRTLLDQVVRTIENPNYNADKSDFNKATMLRSEIGNLLEEQGKYNEALEYRKGESDFVGELQAFIPTQKSTDSVENARVTKSMQSDTTDSLRDFYRQIRLGGTI